MWTPTNVNPKNYNIDDVLGIPGLTSLLLTRISPNTYCNLNICINGLGKTIPNGYNRYILGFWFEVFDEDTFMQVYNNNPQAEFIILTDLAANDLSKFSRCSVVNLYHWKWFLMQYRETVMLPRKYKISSLSNRVTEFRAFVTLKLLNCADALVTWNAHFIDGVNVDYIFSPTGRQKRDSFLKNIEQLRYAINAEQFKNDPEQAIKSSAAHPAYSESLVNSINETKDISWSPDIGILPGPYMTEKTWKPLMNGNALLFTGQFNTCKTLTDLGFVFDYPWSNTYDDLPGDLDRLELIFDTIDQILGMTHLSIERGIKHSVDYNQNYIRSKELVQIIDQCNESGLAQLKTIL